MKKQSVFDKLNLLSIKYETYYHEPVFTVEEAKAALPDLNGQGCKNLFLRDSKGKQHFLVILPEDKPFDLKSFSEKLNLGKLSFASEKRLLQYLDLTPGSVSPFGLINDKDNHVILYIDKELLKSKKVSFHPNDNSASILLDISEFKKFLDSLKNDISWVEI